MARPAFATAVPPGLVIYADGCCEPNPGIGGWACVVYRDGVEVYSESGGDREATNQRMELTAALQGLVWVIDNDIREPVRLFSDSSYTVDACNKWRHGWRRNGWRRGGPKNRVIVNLDLWKALDGALTLHPVQLEWCKGHAGIIGNKRADELSLVGRGTVVDRSPTPLDLIREQLDYSARGCL
ncbi:ribonuclease H [Mesorhizobium sp. B2-1-3A]|uniref:ribonuclease H family protein n=1 Tax=Mesorhizobium sp. B2-1-3A TaxID=2589971 RepID=UPI001128CDDB|nr:ribonuclease H [Mesorhizobium sp. B2-1-3A]TPM90629.1 ribonuclease HI [Mesorhizobium sp. B2-1-3A]